MNWRGHVLSEWVGLNDSKQPEFGLPGVPLFKSTAADVVSAVNTMPVVPRMVPSEKWRGEGDLLETFAAAAPFMDEAQKVCSFLILLGSFSILFNSP